MGSCSLCKANGVTKATCPLNPKSKNPQPQKHSVPRKTKSIRKMFRMEAKHTPKQKPLLKESQVKDYLKAFYIEVMS